MLSQVAKRLKEREVDLSYDDTVVKHLAKAGFDDQYGARPLRRVIQRTIEDSLSEQLIGGKIHLGEEIRMKMDGDQIVFEQA